MTENVYTVKVIEGDTVRGVSAETMLQGYLNTNVQPHENVVVSIEKTSREGLQRNRVDQYIVVHRQLLPGEK